MVPDGEKVDPLWIGVGVDAPGVLEAQGSPEPKFVTVSGTEIDRLMVDIGVAIKMVDIDAISIAEAKVSAGKNLETVLVFAVPFGREPEAGPRSATLSDTDRSKSIGMKGPKGAAAQLLSDGKAELCIKYACVGAANVF